MFIYGVSKYTIARLKNNMFRCSTVFYPEKI